MVFNETEFQSTTKVRFPDRKLVSGPQANMEVVNAIGEFPGTLASSQMSCSNTPYLAGASLAVERTGLRGRISQSLPNDGLERSWLDNSSINILPGGPLRYLNLYHPGFGQSNVETGINAEWVMLMESDFWIGFPAGIGKVEGTGLYVVVGQIGDNLYLDRLVNSRIINPGTLPHYIEPRPELVAHQALLVETVGKFLPVAKLDTFNLLHLMAEKTGIKINTEELAFTVNASVGTNLITQAYNNSALAL